MARTSAPACRVQVYLTDPKVAGALNREARTGRIPLSQAAGRAISRGLKTSPQADPEDRLLRLERSLRDHMRAAARDMQIVQELLIEVARAFFLRLPDGIVDEDPTVQAAVEARIERLLDATAARIVAGAARERQSRDAAVAAKPSEP
ncbi:hypothetical protein [Brevundimonas sp. SL130]|uniref:hypothetical protein n=1 Tax=Brevundimonas sp. SL130 TaxID=2995143 RepID=UPI00226CEC81|nr:hypothetical protein [Brevundimonas sp. SL130]WAC61373.1 hypothetical protein OU998_08010 [Brevundimonas sp. SL130]